MSDAATRLVGQLDAQGHVDPTSYDDFAYVADNNGGATIIYKGWARPGTSGNASGWKIQKLTYDANTPPNVVQIQWPENPVTSSASNDYIFAWSSRGAYTYV